MKFEDRSQEEIERQERCAREAAWKLAKSVLKSKEKNKATFFSPTNDRCLPVPSVIKPEEREFVVDSGTATRAHRPREKPVFVLIGPVQCVVPDWVAHCKIHSAGTQMSAIRGGVWDIQPKIHFICTVPLLSASRVSVARTLPLLHERPSTSTYSFAQVPKQARPSARVSSTTSTKVSVRREHAHVLQERPELCRIGWKP